MNALPDLALNWSCPGGTALLPANQTGSQAWLDLRRSGVGSSELAPLMGEPAKNDSPYLVWLTKTHTMVETEVTPQMRWGGYAEDAAARWFADDTGLTLRRQGLLRSRAEPLALATVDRLSGDGGVLELKVTETGYAYRLAKQLRGNQLPRHWFWQLVWLLFVTGRSHAWLGAVVGGELHIRRLDADQVQRETAIARATVRRFWAEHVTARTAPRLPPGLELVDDGLVLDADRELSVLLARWRDAKTAVPVAEDVAASLRAQVLEAMGRAELVRVGGKPFARRRVVSAERVDVARLRREDPATADRFSVTGAQTRLEII